MLNATDMKGQGLSPNRLYKGKVVDNDDSKASDGKQMLCRVRVRVDEIFEGIPDGDIPWAIPDCVHQRGTSDNEGSYMIPDIGDIVQVYFQDGSPFHPIYKACNPDAKTKVFEMETNYPNRQVDIQKTGRIIIYDKKAKQYMMRDLADTSIFIIGNADLTIDGNVTERITGNRQSAVKGNVDEYIVGNKTTYIEGNVKEYIKGTVEKVVDSNVTYLYKSNYDIKVLGNQTRLTYGNLEVAAKGSHKLWGAPISVNSSASPRSIQDINVDKPEIKLSFDWVGVNKDLPQSITI